MKKTGSVLADWAIHKVESEYKDDVCLLLEHRTLRLDKDQDATSFSFYIPATSRAYGLACTFIIDGIGYDLFPILWERLEKIADVHERNTTLLADAEILYARTDDDRQRFTSLQARLAANLQNPHLMYNRALEWLDTVTGIYQEMLFEDTLLKVREKAGYICDLLSIAVACVNQRYLKHGGNQITELESMKEIPAGFTDLYERIIRAKTPDEQKHLCHEIIVASKRFIEQHDTDAASSMSEPDFSELATWYQELSYTWRRINHFCDMKDPINAYLWCCTLQNEVDKVGAEFSITDIDIFSAFDADNLSALRKRASVVEQNIVSAIEAHGVTIDSYASVEEFLKKNP